MTGGDERTSTATEATRLLGEYVRLHDLGVATGDFAPLAALFGPAGEMAFHGVTGPAARGAQSVERLFRDRATADALVVDCVTGSRSRADCVFGWAQAPGLVAGTLRLEASQGRIARMHVVPLPGGPVRPEEREAVRAVVLARDSGRVLLLRCREPTSGATWWISPGGGVEPGETDEAALRRELAEEVGLEAQPSLGSPAWIREHLWCWGPRALRQRERFFVVPVPTAFEPRPRLSREALLREGLDAEHRWWTIDEVESDPDATFSPRALARHLADLLRDGPPTRPVQVGP